MTDDFAAWIEELKQVCEKAAPGPWTASEREPGDKEVFIDGGDDGHHLMRGTVSTDDCDVDTGVACAQFIVSARTALPRLIAIVEAAEEVMAAQKEFKATRCWPYRGLEAQRAADAEKRLIKALADYEEAKRT